MKKDEKIYTKEGYLPIHGDFMTGPIRLKPEPKTTVKIEVESVENGNARFRIGRDEKLLLGFEITKEQMLTVLEHLTAKIANGESGGSTLTFGEQEEK